MVTWNLINAIKTLSVLNGHLKFIPQFFKWLIGWQVQAIKAERTERGWLWQTVKKWQSSQGKLFTVQLFVTECSNNRKRPFLLREKEGLGLDSRYGLSSWLLGGNLSSPPWPPNVWVPVIWNFKKECSSPLWNGIHVMEATYDDMFNSSDCVSPVFSNLDLKPKPAW